LFLDQRDNRRRVLADHVAAGFPLFADGQAGDSPRPRGGGGPTTPEAARAGGAPREVLNTFAYTCGFSLCAAAAGARTTSIDLSQKYLAWGKRNFALNQIDPARHDFLGGDVFDWLRRLAKKGRRFDLILLDPPTFSQSKEQGAFQAEKDYGKLAVAALRLLKPGGVLFASTNAAKQTPAQFLETLISAVAGAGRAIVQRHYAPQPPDFPITRAEPAYLKTVWLRIA
jgi:23S rRNA (cytosine1962-C5)-methyltransferase